MSLGRRLLRPGCLGLLALILALAPFACALQPAGAVAGATSTPRTAAAPLRRSLTARLDAYLRQEVNAGRFGGSVLIARRGLVLLERGYGEANYQAGVRNTAATAFRIGSVTKQFTAAAILLLQERGKLRVQDAICRYIPSCPAAWRSITIHQVLTHTSGIPDYHQFPEYSRPAEVPSTLARFIADMGTKPLLFVPGTRFSYSDSGYVVAGAVVGKAAGEPYAAFVQDAILTPLHLQHTSFSGDNLPRVAVGYAAPFDRATGLDLPFPSPSGGLYSTASDLYRWDQALNAGQLLSAASLAQMFSPYVAASESFPRGFSQTHYGYGWFITSDYGHLLDFHTGVVPGFRAFNGRYPDDDSEIILLSNLDATQPTDMGAALGAKVLAG
jgi:CubicO group peptidase (beta-lactamase class C family)